MCTCVRWPEGLPTKLRLGELFCGPGGLAMGATEARLNADGLEFGFEHAWANDIDQDTCDTFLKNVPGATPETVICKDVRDLDLTSLPAIDCLAFGFPCNDYSLVGEQLGLEGKFGPLYSYGVAALNLHKPATFVAENVGGLASSDGGETLRMILRELEEAGAGYHITPHLYKAEEYGVPQARHRILIVGVAKDLDRGFEVPAPTHKDRPKTAREALECPQIPENAKNQELTRQASQVVERLKHIKAGQNAFNADLPEDLKLNVRGATISQIYRRLDPDKPSYTVTGSGGGGTHVYHWSENRALTNRERARLQTFPDSFEFKGSKESVRRQIGMAVPPMLAKVVLEALLKSLADTEYSRLHASFHSDGSQLKMALEKRVDYAGSLQ